MRKFRFSLQRLLRLRSQREGMARRELAVAMAEVGSLQGRLGVLEGSLEACREEVGAASPAAELAKALETGLLHSRGRVRKVLAQAEGRAEIRRGEYRERKREATALQRLFEHRRRDWAAGIEREIQALSDEVARVRFESQRRQGEME